MDSSHIINKKIDINKKYKSNKNIYINKMTAEGSCHFVCSFLRSFAASICCSFSSCFSTIFSAFSLLSFSQFVIDADFSTKSIMHNLHSALLCLLFLFLNRIAVDFRIICIDDAAFSNFIVLIFIVTDWIVENCFITCK